MRRENKRRLDLDISSVHQEKLVEKIVHFVEGTSGLKIDWCNEFSVNIQQISDKKSLSIRVRDLRDVILRQDSQNRDFIQVDFLNGFKVLLTQVLIGFKPYPINGLDMKEVPRVVTTADLYRVFQAIEEAISFESNVTEVEVLGQIFRSILRGGEVVGFDLQNEKSWFYRLSYFTASA